MQAIRLILFPGVLFCLCIACIEPFTPNIDDGKQLLVINGTVTNEEGYQYAEISYTSPFNDPEFNPINDCQATIIDDKGNEFEMTQYANGKYRTWIEEQYLQTGNQFKIEVVLNHGEGKKYVSEFDTLLPCPDLDSLYYEYKYVVPDDPNLPPQEGIQFYIDFDATGNFASNYRWEAIETWEYHAEEKIHIVYYGVESRCCDPSIDYPRWDPCYDVETDSCWAWLDLEFLNPVSSGLDTISDSLFICWKSNNISSIFTYTSHQRNDKKVTGMPLYLVTNKEGRLSVKYSILVNQIALSDAAFVYWSQLQTQAQESGGLYDTQPYELKGNLKCLDDENEKVIGIFSASSETSKRFIGRFNINSQNYYCGDIIEGWDFLQQYLWGGVPGLPAPPNGPIPHTPLYLHPFFDEFGFVRTDTFSLRDQSCTDCRLRGGTTTKPDYWYDDE